MRKAAVTCGVIGLVLLIVGGLLAWWITPSYVAQVPSNYNKTRTYTGTIQSLFNPAALAAGNTAGALRHNLPATLTDNVKVLQTSGGKALIQDTRIIKASGSPVATTVQHYAVDRSSLEATNSHPSNWVVTPAKGLTVSWPFGAKKQTYTGWVPLTETTTPVRFIGESQQGGITTYEYRATVPPTRIKNAQVLGSLPKSLPTSLVPQLVAAGLVTPGQAAGLATVFPHATSIPLGYTYQATNTYFVAPATGLVVNVANNETETGAVALPNGTLAPVVPVLADTYHATPASLSQAVSDARNGDNAISALGVDVPIAFAALGFVLVVLAIYLWMRKRSRGRPVEPRHGQRHPSPAGHVT
jgi:Porin PorA